MATWHGGETTARPRTARKPCHALLASQGDCGEAVGARQSNACGERAVRVGWPAMATAASSALLWAEAGAKEEAGEEMRVHGSD